ncbi:BatC protein [Streptomyces sp. NPDC058611]|uniref:BatC protein n=1 Tax=unclassified Streptomyces TaxID=2593676 RepID=UPI00365A5743
MDPGPADGADEDEDGCRDGLGPPGGCGDEAAGAADGFPALDVGVTDGVARGTGYDAVASGPGAEVGSAGSAVPADGDGCTDGDRPGVGVDGVSSGGAAGGTGRGGPGSGASTR